MTAYDWLRIFDADASVQIDGKGKLPIGIHDQAPSVSPDCHGDQWCRCDDCEDGRLSAGGGR